jgi:hypothetical protein
MKKLSPILTALLVLAFTLPGLGYRHLWQDEIETAERARTILESGYPRVIDASGALSLNVGGREIEDGAAHRHSPWMQFYVASAGLWLAERTGWSRDAGVRLPFALSHAAASGLVAGALMTYAGAPALLANGIGLALGTQSIRLMYNRSARYHALLDLFVALGMAGLAAFRHGRRWGLPAVSTMIFLLPHVHTLAGSLYSLTLGAMASWAIWQARGPETLASKARQIACYVALPGLLSLAAVLAITRPTQKDWTWWRVPNLRSLKEWGGLTYALCFWVAGIGWTWWRGARRYALILLAFLALVLCVLALVERFPSSQPRYYFSLALIGLFWPLAFGMDWANAWDRRWLWRIVLVLCVLPEMLVWLQSTRGVGLDSEKHWFYPLQGLRVVADDARKWAAGEQQPLHQAMAHIREHGAPDEAILVDYVPQYVNWYLPGRPIALMPDPTFRAGFNRELEVWNEPPPLPEWHLWYPSYGSGTWLCLDECDFEAMDYQKASGRYVLRSKRLDTSVEMCPVMGWKTHQWNNAPFMNLLPSSRRAGGDSWGLLLLARPCASVER